MILKSVLGLSSTSWRLGGLPLWMHESPDNDLTEPEPRLCTSAIDVVILTTQSGRRSSTSSASAKRNCAKDVACRLFGAFGQVWRGGSLRRTGQLGVLPVVRG